MEANSAVKTHLEAAPEDIVGKYCPKVIHDCDGPFPGCPLEEAVEKGQAIEREVLDERTNRWLRSAVYPVKGWTRDGKRIYFHMVTDITELKQAEKQLDSLLEQYHSLSTHLETMREEDRKRIARELHDEICQNLASQTAYAEAALNLTPGERKSMRGLLEKIEDISISTNEKVEKIIYDLRPAVLDDLGVVAATKSLVEGSLKEASTAAKVKTIGQEVRLPSEIEVALFRVVQEATRNIIRHSEARNTSVTLRFGKSKIVVRIEDDGKGFDVEEAMTSKNRPRGLGLLGMRERAELLNGTLDISSYSSRGLGLR